jgi:hypothetical protein
MHRNFAIPTGKTLRETMTSSPLPKAAKMATLIKPRMSTCDKTTTSTKARVAANATSLHETKAK